MALQYLKVKSISDVTSDKKYEKFKEDVLLTMYFVLLVRYFQTFISPKTSQNALIGDAVVPLALGSWDSCGSIYNIRELQYSFGENFISFQSMFFGLKNL